MCTGVNCDRREKKDGLEPLPSRPRERQNTRPPTRRPGLPRAVTGRKETGTPLAALCRRRVFFFVAHKQVG